MSTVSARWTRIASTVRLQRSSQTISVVADKAWIFGGELLPRQPLDNHLDVVELFEASASTRTISARDDAAAPRVGSASAVVNDEIYFFSGRGGIAMAPIEEEGRLWRYTPSDSQWSLISPTDSAAPYPAARSYHAMTNDGISTIYVHAGCPETGRLSDLWSFDVDTRIWKSLAAAPEPARGGTSIVYCDGRLYRLNGFDGKKEQGGDLDVYDISQGSWSSVTYPADGEQGPEARSVSALLALHLAGRKMLVTLFGEHDPSSSGHAGAGKMLGNAWAYDIDNNKWTKSNPIGETPQPRGWFDADVVKGLDGKQAIVVHGGLAEDNSRLGDVWTVEFDIMP